MRSSSAYSRTPTRGYAWRPLRSRPALRKRPLAAHRALLTELIGSPALTSAAAAATHARDGPHPVDELIFALAERSSRPAPRHSTTSPPPVPGHVKALAELVLRAYAQAPDPTARRALDLIDRLLELRACGIADAVASAEL